MESFTLLDHLARTANTHSDKIAYHFLGDGESESARIAFGELDGRVTAVARTLRERYDSGDRALLLYSAGLEFIVAFLGCLRAGVVAVPFYAPRPREGTDKVLAVAAHCGARAVLTTSALRPHLEHRFGRAGASNALDWLETDALPASASPVLLPPTNTELAFLQYTSGSTGSPKGVMVSHANILQNERMIERAFEHSPESIVVGWLPFFHDMGLIGNMLQPLYLGATGIFMSPMAFLQKPVRWLRAISNYRATTSGGPNFAFDLCVEKITPDQCEGLDLRSWSLAFNGAEPVKRDTLERFTRAFEPYGFRRTSFFPCYGLAEATLFVTGGRSHAGTDVVSCGRPEDGLEVAIVDPERHVRCPPGQVGEIWLRGPSVACGYWNEPSPAFSAELFEHDGRTREGPFLRTGDLGFLDDGELYVTGRIKDILIVRGRKYHPHDIERTVEGCHAALKPAASAAFTADGMGRERLVILQEVRKEHVRRFDGREILGNVREAVASQHGLTVDMLILMPPGGVLRTSSGKVRRSACRQGVLDGSLLQSSLATFGRLSGEKALIEGERSCS
ncbi:fatty acyl-AMP ligase [Pendulispora brunnea]|uniref:Fatty acyl-AMP ligase n=1 Tax=Pendulispora brunnea TaxID=2905690 RepID=A0ABZ2JY82_9BACT